MTRIDYYKVAPGGIKPLYALEQYLRASQLEPGLLELVKVGAALMNGCAYCVDIHTQDARAKGETAEAVCGAGMARDVILQRNVDPIAIRT